MAGSAGQLAFQLSFQISPLILTGGIASGIPGGMLPIVSLTQSLSFVTGLLSGSDLDDLDDYMAQFAPMPGGTLISQRIGKYTFANQAVAANAVIRDPLNISLLMIVRAAPGMGYATKLATMMALQATLANHNNSGGTYMIATPAFPYTNCVMLQMRDVSRHDTKQPQNAYQLDFEQPLISLAQAASAQNSLMSQISAGVPGSDTTSGLGQTLGSPPTLATPLISPAASNLAGSGVGAPITGVGGIGMN